MTPILQAAAQGYTAQQIISFVSQAFPNLSPRIKKAASQGYTTNQILKYVNQLMEEETFSKFTTPNEREGRHRDRLNQLGKQILGSGATALGLTQFQQNLPPLAQTLLGNPIANAAQQQQMQPQQPNPLPQGQQQTQTIATQTLPPGAAPIVTPPQQLQLPGTQQQLPQAVQQTVTPLPQQPPLVNSADIIRQMELEPKINNLLKAGNPPETIGAILEQSLTPGAKKWLDSQIKEGKAKPLSQMVQEYAANPPEQTAPIAPESRVEAQAVPEVKEEEKKRPLSKGSVVATPSGLVGEIETARNGQALVKDDAGKLHKLKITDLQMPDESVGKTVARLLEIPEIEKSGPLNYWAYDEPDNELFIMYHNGETYKYKEVPPDLVAEIEKAAVAPKTKGENMYGAWSPEDKPEYSEQAGREILSRGATMSKLIINHPKYKKPKKGEPENPYYRKLKKGYDYFIALRGK